MKNSILVCVLILITCSIQAQSKPRVEKRIKQSNQLGLSDDQRSQMKTIRDHTRNMMRSIKTSDLTKEEKRTSMKALHQELRNDVSTILSKSQLEQWDEIQERRKARKHKKRQVTRALDLTDAQKKQYKTVMMNHRSSMKKIVSSAQSLEEKRAGKNALKKRTRKDLKRILTNEQLNRYDQMRESRKKRSTARLR